MPFGIGYGDDDKTLADKVRNVRDSVQRKQTAAKAKKRAKARRIEMEKPESISETVAVKRRRASEAADEFSGLVEDSKDLASTKFGSDGMSDSDGGLFEAIGNEFDTIAENAADTDLSEPLMQDSGTTDLTDPMMMEDDEMLAPTDPVDPLDDSDDLL